ncbi:MAG: radical SAM family heme chaperone HemW [Lachnospiraceae bacterium]|nr:radical SAM family heme chaperone HemW [Lachnospiraceae bacterium]
MDSRPLSIYIHIPFCVRKCAYCDFLSFPPSGNNIELYMEALLEEIGQMPQLDRSYRVKTVFIGGGTPSCLPPFYISEILCKLKSALVLEASAEITMELNPGTADRESLASYKRAGINRLSIGCQSTDPAILKRLGRIHTREDFFQVYQEAREVGFDNINVDLISSAPGETCDIFQRSLSEIISLKPEHISVYSLIIEPGTPFHQAYGEGKLDLPDEDTVERIDEITGTCLAQAGYQRYEISNYAMPGRECAHNQVYWNREPYLGLGLGAASLLINPNAPYGRRFSNTRDLREYLASPGRVLSEDRVLCKREAMEEFLFLGLRQTGGIEEDSFLRAFGESLLQVFGREIEKQVSQGFMVRDSGRYFYTDRGLELSNILMSEFLD